MSDLRTLANTLTVEAVLVSCGIEPPTRGRRIKCPIHKGDGLNFDIVPDDPCRWYCFSRSCGAEARRDAVNLLGYLRYGGHIKMLPAAQKVDLLRSCEELSGVKLDDRACYGQDPDRKLGGLTKSDAAHIVRLIANPDLLKIADSDDFDTVPGKMALVWMQCSVAMGREIDKKLLEDYIVKRGWHGYI